MSVSDTIYALASGAGTVALSVVRVSGGQSRAALEVLAGQIAEARHCYLRELRDPATGEILDEAIVIWFPGPKSFTGEDSAELHIHGGRAVQAGVLGALSRLSGLRMAEPGEFTRRAVINGKMDLVEAEGLGDVLLARSAYQRRQAMAQMRGDSSSIFDSWRERLLLIRAEIEAAIDFSDEQGVADAVQQSIDLRIGELLSDLRKAETHAARAAVIRDGVRIVLAGMPNTGKSSLLNSLVRREAAIVSAIPGTTRDAIEVFLDLGGVPALLTDTAGLRDNVSDEIEAEGIRRSWQRLADAHIVVWVASGDVPGSDQYGPEVIPDILVAGKCDVAESISRLYRNENSIRPRFSISAVTDEGIDAFLRALTEHAKQEFGSEESPVVVTERQKAITAECIHSLQRALLHSAAELELKAEETRVACDAVGRLTGRVDVEEWLGAIFSRFCIGK